MYISDKCRYVYTYTWIQYCCIGTYSWALIGKHLVQVCHMAYRLHTYS